jgi:hypothetical protein
MNTVDMAKFLSQGADFVPQYAGCFLHLPRYARYKSFSEPVNILF